MTNSIEQEEITQYYSNEYLEGLLEIEEHKKRINALELAIFRLLFEIEPTSKQGEKIKTSTSAIENASNLLSLRRVLH
jgi:hypothetical protein